MDIAILNVHLDLGGVRRGTDMGPSALHVAGLVPRLGELGHRVVDVASVTTRGFEGVDPGDPQARFLPAIRDCVAEVSDRVFHALLAGRFPLVLGGDHAQAIGTISGMVRYHRTRTPKARLGVLWVDAHTDMNTPETSPSGNIHGMPLAVLLGHGPSALLEVCGPDPILHPKDVAILGARDVDGAEAALVRETGVRVYTMSELDERGVAACTREAFDRATSGTIGTHLSFDLDGVDPTDAPGVGTPVPGGLTLRESLYVCEAAHRTGRLQGMELVELNPTLDERNRTGALGVWLIVSALGKVIL
ncbi:MAG: arginase [Pseudomonadota bacterium]